MVAGFMALLKFAVTTAPWQTPIAPPNGTTETTVGGVREGGGAPLLVSGSPHPVIPTAKRNAVIQILAIFNLRMSFSSSHSCQAIHVEPRYCEYREYTDDKLARLYQIEHPQNTSTNRTVLFCTVLGGFSLLK
jgi:hypothetical protein